MGSTSRDETHGHVPVRDGVIRLLLHFVTRFLTNAGCYTEYRETCVREPCMWSEKMMFFTGSLNPCN